MQQQKFNLISDIFKKASETYTSCYCEENVYQLCKKFQALIDQKQLDEQKHQAFAVFVTNPFQCVQMRCQQSGKKNQHQMIQWDYHVIFLHKIFEESATQKINQTFVYDFDTTLEWPCTFEEYYNKSINFQKIKDIMFRPVLFTKLLEVFASDRSHMLAKDKNGQKMKNVYTMPPPSYNCIINQKGETNNLNRFLDCGDQGAELGLPYISEQQFKKMFQQKIQQLNDNKQEQQQQSVQAQTNN